uniref:Tail fiber protein n=1 Tax=Salmonella phage vB_SEnST11_KE22 TaxID=3161173 RepID=A0AAU8GFD5_9CAUD
MEELLLATPEPVGDQFQYAGTLTQAQFIPYADLVKNLAPTTAFGEQSGFKYFVFSRGNVTVVVPSHPVGRMSYNNIYLQGAVFGSGGTGKAPNGVTPLCKIRPSRFLVILILSD